MKPTMIAALWMAGTFAVSAGTATPVFAGATTPAAIMTGLVDASAAKDAAYAAFAAKMLLDSVDLLEGQFTSK
jgi:hypothetical protein